MWGNWQGWTISAVLLVLMGWMVWLIGQANALSAPSAFSRNVELFEVIALPVPPQSIVPMPRAEDAAPLYRQAIAEYLGNRDRYDRFREKGRLEDVPLLSALRPIIEATDLSRCTLAETSLSDTITYQNEKPALDALKVLADCAIRAALLSKATEPAEAKRYYAAVFSLGAKLFGERVIARQMRLGLEMMATSSAGMKSLAQSEGDLPRVAALEEFDRARTEFFKTRIEPVIKVLLTIDSNTIARHPGDYFYLAQKSPERLWRVEAILATGRLRYNIGVDGRVGDQRGAMTVLRKLESDPDPVIRQAAKAASELTLEQYRVIRDLY